MRERGIAYGVIFLRSALEWWKTCKNDEGSGDVPATRKLSDISTVLRKGNLPEMTAGSTRAKDNRERQSNGKADTNAKEGYTRI
jgi:hypothetical protein